eukprot:21938-Pyramimonas_sp.AAC.1
MEIGAHRRCHLNHARATVEDLDQQTRNGRKFSETGVEPEAGHGGGDEYGDRLTGSVSLPGPIKTPGSTGTGIFSTVVSLPMSVDSPTEE